MAYTDEDLTESNELDRLTPEERYNLSLAEEKAKHEQYQAALRAEFASLDIDDPETQKRVRAEVFELIPIAASTVNYLMTHAESEAVRANLAKWVLSEGMKSAEKDKPKDFVSELFDRLKTDEPIEDAEVTDVNESDN